MSNLDRLRARVQGYLTAAFNSVTLDGDGDFSVRSGSARVFVRPTATGPDPDSRTVVALWTILLRGVNDTPELWKHVAFHADDFLFGHLSLKRSGDGAVSIFFTHQLLGDYLDQAELEVAVAALVTTTDKLDDQLQARFGGTRFHEE
jgi:hypothetical protein